MPITKDIELESGVTVGYHRIIHIAVDYLGNYVTWRVGSYIDSSAFGNGKQPVTSTGFSSQFISSQLNTELRAFLYDEMVNQVGGVFYGGTLD